MSTSQSAGFLILFSRCKCSGYGNAWGGRVRVSWLGIIIYSRRIIELADRITSSKEFATNLPKKSEHWISYHDVRFVKFHWANLKLVSANIPKENPYKIMEMLFVSTKNFFPIFCQARKSKNEISRSSRPEVFCKKGVLRNFAKSTGKHLCQSLFFLIFS